MHRRAVRQTLQIRLLGGFQLVYDTRPVTSLLTARLKSLLAFLLLHRDTPQPRGYVAFLLWPDSSESQARTNLRHLLHALRQCLPDADRLLSIDAQHIQWNTDDRVALDVAQFEAAVAAGALEKAVEIYHGDLLPDCYDDWLIAERERLRQTYLDVLWEQLGRQERAGDYRAAIGSAQRLLQLEPLHEELHRVLMRLHVLNQDRAAALQVYHACAGRLQTELGVDPGPATQALYHELLAAPPEAGVKRPAVSYLVGRAEAWAFLEQAWQAAQDHRPHLALILGETGMGKTALCQAFAAQVQAQGVPVLVARCFPAEGVLPFAPVAEWLRARPLPPLERVWRGEIARLLPELLAEDPELSPPRSLVEDWQRHHLYDALVRALLPDDGSPLLLVVDDVQWCDPATTNWLSYLLRARPGAPYLVLAAARSEDFGDNLPLRSLCAELHRRDQIADLVLPPLNRDDALALARHAAGTELDPAACDGVCQESAGNPFFIVELARAAAGRGVGDMPPLPVRLRQAIEARLTALSPAARDLADLAATAGLRFEIAMVQQAAGLAEAAFMSALDELQRQRLLREEGPARARFSHRTVRDALYDGIPPARRAALHRRMALALRALHAGASGPVSGQIAAHYEGAGCADLAVRFYCEAAGAAQATGMPGEAAALLDRACALAVSLPDASFGARRASDLFERLGDICDQTGRPVDARQAFERALALLQPESRAARRRLQRKLSKLRAAR